MKSPCDTVNVLEKNTKIPSRRRISELAKSKTFVMRYCSVAASVQRRKLVVPEKKSYFPQKLSNFKPTPKTTDMLCAKINR